MWIKLLLSQKVIKEAQIPWIFDPVVYSTVILVGMI